MKSLYTLADFLGFEVKLSHGKLSGAGEIPIQTGFNALKIGMEIVSGVVNKQQTHAAVFMKGGSHLGMAVHLGAKDEITLAIMDRTKLTGLNDLFLDLDPTKVEKFIKKLAPASPKLFTGTFGKSFVEVKQI